MARSNSDDTRFAANAYPITQEGPYDHIGTLDEQADDGGWPANWTKQSKDGKSKPQTTPMGTRGDATPND